MRIAKGRFHQRGRVPTNIVITHSEEIPDELRLTFEGKTLYIDRQCLINAAAAFLNMGK